MGYYDELKNVPWSTWEPLVVDDAVRDLIEGVASLCTLDAMPTQRAAFSLAATGMLVGDIIRTSYWRTTDQRALDGLALSRTLEALKPILPPSASLRAQGPSAIRNSLLRVTTRDETPDDGPRALKNTQLAKHDVFRLSRIDLRETLIRRAMPEALPFETCMKVCTQALTMLTHTALETGIPGKDVYNIATTGIAHALHWSGQEPPNPTRRRRHGSKPTREPT